MKLLKKCIIALLISFSMITTAQLITGNVYAEGEVTVKVTEKVPGAGCSGPDDSGIYTCTIGKGFTSVMVTVGKMIKYATFISALWAVLFIVVNGILYSMSWMDAGLKDEAKKRIVKTLLGLILLLLSWVVLNIIAPWVYVV